MDNMICTFGLTETRLDRLDSKFSDIKCRSRMILVSGLDRHGF